jgi:hypothetical protein
MILCLFDGTLAKTAAEELRLSSRNKVEEMEIVVFNQSLAERAADNEKSKKIKGKRS